MKSIKVSDLKLVEILNRVPFFKNFSVAERKVFFAGNMAFLQCRAGEVLIKEGDNETDFYIILSGTASVFVNKGVDKVAEVQGGYFIGEGAFINNRPHRATVKADTEIFVVRLDQQTLRRLPASVREKIKDQIILGMAFRLSEMNIRSLLKPRINS